MRTELPATIHELPPNCPIQRCRACYRLALLFEHCQGLEEAIECVKRQIEAGWQPPGGIIIIDEDTWPERRAHPAASA